MKTNPRRRARELVLQGLYERQLGGAAAEQIAADLRDSAGHQRADQPYFGELWSGVARDYDALMARVAPYLDRKPKELSPIERALIVKPNVAAFHNNLGFSYSALGRFEEALWHFQEALRLQPDFAMAYNNMGKTYREQGKFADRGCALSGRLFPAARPA